jgi:hypothetical protein
MKKPWVRPEGCECDEASPARHRCTEQWVRCQARITFELRRAKKAARKLLRAAQ